MNPFAEKFTKEEAYFVSPFFTNLDRNVFAAKYLPSEVLGALASRYSRSTKGVRRLFFDEYIKPILEPNLEGATKSEINEAEVMKRELISFVDYLRIHGGWESVVNSKRARDFFAKWLAAYGDDSIAQMAGAHIFFENVSQIATKVFEDFRIGFAPLEKSTRYVMFDQKFSGRYLYFSEPDIVKSKYGKEYIKLMNLLFDSYSVSIPTLSKVFKKRFPQEKDQSDRAYAETIKAKTCDVLRAYLPAATLTNVGFFGIGQTLDYVITKGLSSNLVEINELAKAAQNELMQVVPSMVERATSERGKVYQGYVAKTERELEKMARKFLTRSHLDTRRDLVNGPSVELVEWDNDAENRIVASLLYKYSTSSYQNIKDQVSKMNPKQKLSIIKKVVGTRQVRQHRLVRAFENTYYKFDIVTNFGAYRDLHRHRMMTQERQRFTTELGLDTPRDLSGKLKEMYETAGEKVNGFYKKIKKDFPDAAQYVVMMGNRIRWYQFQNLRSFAWEAELRTGPQGHPDYRWVEHQKVKLVKKMHPALMEALKFVDFKEYDLARRESEKRIDKKLQAIK